MKYSLLLIVVCVTCPLAVIAKIDSLYFHGTNQLNADTLFVKNINNPVQPLEWYEKNFMVWVAALGVAILTVVVNLIISYFTRRTSIEAVDNQIKASLYSKNRQDWINEVRNELSLFLANTKRQNVHWQIYQRDEERESKNHDDTNHTLNKLQLLLDPRKEDHKALLTEIDKMVFILDKHWLNTKSGIKDYDNVEFLRITEGIIDKGRTLLYHEWQKIQKPLKKKT